MEPTSKFIELYDAGNVNDISAHEVASSAYCASAIVENPRRFLATSIVFTVISILGTIKLIAMKGGATLFNPKGNSEALRGFPQAQPTFHDAMIFWCNDCNIQADADFIDGSTRAVRLLTSLRWHADNHICSDLRWSGLEMPNANVDQSFYLSKDRTTTFIEFRSANTPCMLAAKEGLKEITMSSGSFHMALGGPQSLQDASMHAESQTARGHLLIAMPVCAVILWLAVGNIFRASVPMLCVVASYLAGKAFVVIVKFCVPSLNIHFNDSAILFIVLALCVDYALFIWTRFSDIRRNYPKREDYTVALAAALHDSGKVILISNFFVTIAYFCTLLLPYMNHWGYLGLYVQAAAASVFAMIYSMMLLPALAAAFPHLFDDGDCECVTYHERSCSVSLVQASWRCYTAVWKHLPSPQSLWFRWANFITGRPQIFIIPIVLYAWMIYCIIPLAHYKPSYDSESQLIRRDVIETQAWLQFESKFSVGMMLPVTLVLQAEPLVPAKHETGEDGDVYNIVFTPEYGSQFCNFARHIEQATRDTDCQVTADDMLGLWWIPRPRLWWAPYLPAGDNECVLDFPRIRWAFWRHLHVRDPLGSLSASMKEELPEVLLNGLSTDGRKMKLNVMTSFRPTSLEALHFDQIIRQLIQKANTTFESGGQRFAFHVTQSSMMQIQVDAGVGLQRTFPKLVCIFGPVALLAVSLWFKSAFIPVKLALTVVVPIVTTYGMTIAVYQMHAMDWTGIRELKGTDGLDFRMIVLTAGLQFGYAMDYDLFLFARVHKYRLAGYDNLSAVKRGLVETGPVITTAGTLMVFSFFCIMCAHTHFMASMGFIFTVGVLFDTMVVRTTIAPVFLIVGEVLNYWPSKMPVPTKVWGESRSML